MSSELQTIVDGTTVERVLLDGDLGKLTAAQRVAYYGKVCDSLGLNPLTRPFEYIVLNGKLTLYARREATEQLRSLRHVSLTIAAREVVEDTYLVTARAVLPDGRTDESIGAKAIGNLKGEARANAMMTAETKAKRRVTLSICGLGLLDETEVADIPLPAVKRSDDVPAVRQVKSAELEPAPTPITPITPITEAPELPELPAGFVRIVEIREAPTRNAGVTRHSVLLSSGEEVTTINPWLASLAQNAREAQTPVRVSTKPTKYGTQITAIDTGDTPIDPAPVPVTGDMPF